MLIGHDRGGLPARHARPDRGHQHADRGERGAALGRAPARGAAPTCPSACGPPRCRGRARLEPPLAGGDVYTDDKAPVEWLIDKSIVDYASGRVSAGRARRRDHRRRDRRLRGGRVPGRGGREGRAVRARRGGGAAASGRNSGSVQHPFDPVLAELHVETLEHYRGLDGLDLPERAGGRADARSRAARRSSRPRRRSARDCPELEPALLDPRECARSSPARAAGSGRCRLETGYPVRPVAATRAFARRAYAAGAALPRGRDRLALGHRRPRPRRARRRGAAPGGRGARGGRARGRRR